MFVIFTYLLLLYGLQSTDSQNSQKRRILPGDPYQILGEPGFRRNGRCNISYAWLIPPSQSTLDAYGHALACTRLQLMDGQLVSNRFNKANENIDVANRPDDELENIDKQLSASMVDLNRLDLLIRSEQFQPGFSPQANHLSDQTRYFYLADRVGDLNIMVILRPGQAIKLEVINPAAPEHHVTPQNVLCLRQQCPKSLESQTNEYISFSYANNTQKITRALISSENQNRELYMQLIISRVACALLGFLSIVFAGCALVLCFRLRSHNSRRRKHLPSDLSMCRDPLPSPSYMQPNGKLSHGRGTPIYPNIDTSPRHVSSETASVTNMLMTASNLTDCGGVHGAHISYANPYGQLYAYPTSQTYTDGNGVYNLVSLPSRTANGSVLLPCHNGSASPAPSNHSMHEYNPHSGGVSVVRTGSMGRYPNSHPYHNERRKLVRVNKQTLPTRPEFYRQGLLNSLDNDPKLVNLQDTKPLVSNTHEQQGPIGHTFQAPLANDLINFQSNGGIHRLPVLITTPRVTHHTNGYAIGNTISTNGYEDENGTASIDCETHAHEDQPNTKSNCLVNHINDTGVEITRKPAIAK